jgi:hypothetical protein
MIRTLTVLSLLVLPVTGVAQGKLDEVREAVDKPTPDSTPAVEQPATDDSSSLFPTPDPSSSDAGPAAAAAGLFAAANGLGLPVATFSPYPYAVPGSRYLWLDRSGASDLSVRASVEAGSDFDGLSRTGLRLFLDSDTRFGFKTDWDYYSERLASGSYDSLWLGDATATLRVFQTEALQVYLGAGLRFLVDGGRDRGGLNLLFGFEAFPGRPVHLFGSIETGTLGNADVFRFRGGAGVDWRWLEAFAGYDYLRIGGADLQGPFVGLRVWF